MDIMAFGIGLPFFFFFFWGGGGGCVAWPGIGWVWGTSQRHHLTTKQLYTLKLSSIGLRVVSFSDIV